MVYRQQIKSIGSKCRKIAGSCVEDNVKAYETLFTPTNTCPIIFRFWACRSDIPANLRPTHPAFLSQLNSGGNIISGETPALR